jgi:outer membrane protein OmpA-like peptidoglycan-associated protein/tetratricopeptide (TPR) repeat protein
MRFNKIFILAFCLSTFSAFAQNVEFKAGNFKEKKDEFKAAVSAIKEGDELFELANQDLFKNIDARVNFKKAQAKFEVAQKLNPENAENNLKLGVCIYNTTNPDKAFPYIEKAYKLDKACHDFMDYYYGAMKQLQGDFTAASKHFKAFQVNYKRADDYASFVSQRIKENGRAPDIVASPIRCWVDNVKEINSEFNDIAPSISTDGTEIIFSSNRPNGHTKDEVGDYDFDIYGTSFNSGKWGSPKPVKGAVNSANDDVSNNLYFDGTKMLFHRKVEGKTDLYESELMGANWTKPSKLHPNISSSKYDEKYGAYGADDVKLFFSRNTGGGNGYNILYSGLKDAVRMQYGVAAPASPYFNSKFDDGPIYQAINGEVMYICSKGQGSIGGYDIFKSVYESGKWTKPENMGYPINTPYDDFFFAITANNKYAYISSNREGGKGGFDIYKVTFWGPEKEHAVETEDYLLASIAYPISDNQIEASVDVNKVSLTVFKGITIDHLTRKPVQAELEIIDNKTGKIISTFKSNSASGKFLLSLVAGKNYGIAVKADGYLFHSENFDIPDGSAYNLVNKTIELKNIKVGSVIALRNIFFDTGKSTLRPESNSELDRLVKLMKDVSNLKIEIGGHTDNTGSAKLNEGLSADRAKAVMNYLVSKGISGSRMTFKGYGPNKPIATNNTADGRQQNRRTEIKITGN